MLVIVLVVMFYGNCLVICHYGEILLCLKHNHSFATVSHARRGKTKFSLA